MSATVVERKKVRTWLASPCQRVCAGHGFRFAG